MNYEFLGGTAVMGRDGRGRAGNSLEIALLSYIFVFAAMAVHDGALLSHHGRHNAGNQPNFQGGSF